MPANMLDDHEFKYEMEVRIRVRDLDHMNHVNNSMYATYMEQARTDYFRDILDLRLDEIEIAVVSSHIEFERQVRYGGRLTVQVRVPELGRSSFPFEYRFLDGDEVAATARTVQVALDTGNEAARPLPDDWRIAVAEYEEIPEGDGPDADE